jgi:hypothetical protein
MNFDFLAWLPGSETVNIRKDKENCTKILEAADLIFTLDFNALPCGVDCFSRSEIAIYHD